MFPNGLEINASAGSTFSDESFIGYSLDGVSPAVIAIDNDKIDIISDPTGSIIDYDQVGNSATVDVYFGGVLDTANWDIAFESSNASNLSFNVTEEGNKVKVTDLDSSVISEAIIVTATPKDGGLRATFSALVQNIIVVLRKQGDKGADGTSYAELRLYK